MKVTASFLAVLALATAVSAHASPRQPLGAGDARHLLARTGFGPTAAEVQAFAPLTREEAVDRLLAATRTEPLTPVPASMLTTTTLRPPGPDATAEARRAFQQQQTREGLELRAWWIQEMTATPSPLTERMTLFWHNHFVSSQQKVRVARLMYRQNVTLRAHALGSFGALLHAAAKDAAMIVYLDVAQNRRGQPNENFAREVMELFTLGEGRYAENDVKEAARAFTGWSLDRETGAFVFRPALHDAGTKVVLGRSGRFDGDQVLDLLLDEPAVAEHVVAKLWREFISPEPDIAEVRRIAARFRSSDLSIKAALRELFLADAFWSPGQRGTLVKAPVELVVGTLRQLDMHPADGLAFAIAASGMGQNLFSPPNVKGWPGGEAWINASTLLARKQFLERIARVEGPTSPAMRAHASASAGEVPPAQAIATTDDDAARRQLYGRALERGMRELTFDAAAWFAAQPGATPADKARAAQALLLPLPLQAVPADGAAALVRATLLDAAYQLK